MEVQKHSPGAFCWIELGTTDQEAAKKFYHELFDWESNDFPIGPDGNYTIFKKRDLDVAALYQLQKEQLDLGVPPHWLVYVSSSDVDASAEAVKAAGGTIVMGPIDVMEEGRMVVVQDPTGATFAIWQPKKNIGVKMINEDNTMCWHELHTRDVTAAKDFYGKVFGWMSQTKGEGPDSYTEFYRGEGSERQANGGMMAIREDWGEVPSNWMVYFAVSDCDALTAKAESLGGRICMPPMDIPGVGRFSVIQDPQGAAFSVIKLDFIV